MRCEEWAVSGGVKFTHSSIERTPIEGFQAHCEECLDSVVSADNSSLKPDVQ